MVSDLLLELLNGNWAIASVSLMIVTGLYLGHETIALGWVGAWDWRQQASRRMRVALAIMTSAAGVAIRSIEIARWRMEGAFPDDLSQIWLTVGTVLAIVGFLCAIREISKPLFGDMPWMFTLIAMAAYTTFWWIWRFV